MKYMTFNRSCSYAGIANLLEEFNIDYQDNEIIRILGIPYLFLYDARDNSYVAGAMIQGSTWFNYFLNSIGYDLVEERLNKKDAIEVLDASKYRYMLGLRLNKNRNQKHAVLYEGKMNGGYRFLNPKHIDSSEPVYYTFNKEELLEMLNTNVLMGHLVKNTEIRNFNVYEYLKLSLANIDKYQKELIDFCSTKQEVKSLIDNRERLFAPLLLDVFSMMTIIGEMELANHIKIIRNKYIELMKEDRTLLIIDKIPRSDLECILSEYKKIIKKFAKNNKKKITL